MIQIHNKEDCCGCNACGDVCPVSAISFSSDIEGFWYPTIDLKKCINCGLCEKVCPIINISIVKKNDLKSPICYVAENKNLKTIFDSTSGGLFSAFAELLYERNGFVGGAIYNDDFSVRHYISNKSDDLEKLRSSKYLQSNANGLYKTICELLNKEKNIVVCGTPCQMAALRLYLGKDYDNLLILDFICRGVNSPKVWRKYLDSFEERYGSPVIYSKSKSKEFGWRKLTQKVILADGQVHYETRDTSNFMKGFLQTNVYCRPSCYKCCFKGLPRMADITLADYWGIEKIAKKIDKDIGLSVCMINSKKGIEYFDLVKNKIRYLQTDLNSIITGNPCVLQSLPLPSVNRDSFFFDLEKMSFENLSKKYIKLSLLASIKKNIRFLLKTFFFFAKTTQCSIPAICRTLRYSSLFSLLNKRGLFFTPCSFANIYKENCMRLNGALILGSKGYFKTSRLETRLLLMKDSILNIDGDFSIGYGSDIEVFENAQLIIKGSLHSFSYTNINLTLICGEKIEIGSDVIIGRDVSIRDTNGGHFINYPEYLNTKPVKIGNKVWIASGSTIMPGVTIGDGAIIGANTTILKDVPPYTLVVGNPQRIVREHILWKP